MEAKNQTGSFDRSFYELKPAFEVKNEKISAIDTSDNVVVLGDKKGYVFAYDESIGARKDGKSGSESNFELLNSGKRG